MEDAKQIALTQEVATEGQLFAEYAVTPQEAQAWLTHLGYGSKDMWELLDQEANLAIPIGSHHLRMIARVACSEEPVLLESLDSNRYAYGGGHWDVDEVREDAVRLKKWFREQQLSSKKAEQEGRESISREQVLAVLRAVDKSITSPYDLRLYESEFDEDGAEIDCKEVWAEGGEEAEDTVGDWTRQESEKVNATGTTTDILEHFFAKATIWYDAGYHNPDYLEEVLGELLDIGRVAEEKGLSNLLNRIKQKIDDINVKLSDRQ